MLQVKIGKRETSYDAEAVEIAVKRFVSVKKQMDELAKTLDAIKAEILPFAKNVLEPTDAASVTLEYDGSAVKVSFGWDVKIEDVEGLRAALGEKFELLVKEERVYKPETRLKEMALSDSKLAKFLSVKEKTPSFSVV